MNDDSRLLFNNINLVGKVVLLLRNYNGTTALVVIAFFLLSRKTTSLLTSGIEPAPTSFPEKYPLLLLMT